MTTNGNDNSATESPRRPQGRPPLSPVAHTLRKLKKQLGVSNRHIARVTDMNVTTVRRILAGGGANKGTVAKLVAQYPEYFKDVANEQPPARLPAATHRASMNGSGDRQVALLLMKHGLALQRQGVQMMEQGYMLLEQQ